MNTKHPLYKERIRLQAESAKLREIQRNQNWIELEKPYKSGYFKFFDLRDDIKNREDAWVFYECIRLATGQIWWRDKAFKRKLKKGKYENVSPVFGKISEKTYDALHPSVKKQFAEIGPWSRDWNPFRRTYECIVPSYYFVEKIKPCWITHYKEHDSLIAQQEAEVYDALQSNEMRPVNAWYSDRPGLSSYAREKNRSDRAKNKQTLRRNLKSGGEDMDKYEYIYNHKHSALWEYW